MVILNEEYVQFIQSYVKHLEDDVRGTSDWTHLGKVMEELGEAAEALIISYKMNPRKREEADDFDVAMEYGDVIMSALVAIAALGININDLLGQQLEKTRSRVWWDASS